MKTFLYVGGIPRAGTMSTACFVHLHPSCFMYMVMNGRHPPNQDFYDKLKERHRNGKYDGQRFAVPRHSLDSGKQFEACTEEKNKTWDASRVFALPVIGVREDFATDYFLKAKQMEPSGMGGRMVRHIFPVRRNVERLFYSQYEMKLQDQHHIAGKAKEFVTRLDKAFSSVKDAIKKYSDDVLITNIVDSSDRRRECERITEFLDLDPTELQLKWMEEHPPMNMYGQYVRDIVREIEEHPFYKEYIE